MSMIRHLSATRRTRAALLLTSAGIGLALATPASAQCAFEANPETATCSGENGSSLGLSTGGNLTVTTQPGFSVTEDFGDAVTISAGRSLTYTDVNASPIVSEANGRAAFFGGGSSGIGKTTIVSNGSFTGATQGLQVNSGGVGGIEVTLTGVITGGSSFGIALLNVAQANDPTISNDTILRANNVSGSSGIAVENRGANGSINLISTGTVTGTSLTVAAIQAFSSIVGVGRDIRVEANNIVAGGAGIQIDNSGRGSSTVILNGTLTTDQRSGINITNAATATDATIIANGTISAGRSGINAFNNGTGSTSVTATAQITSRNLDPAIINGAPSGSGILAINSGSGTTMTVSAAGVDGGRSGIDVRSNGSGDTNVTATGLVQGRNGNGVAVRASTNTDNTVITTAAVIGTEDAILARHEGSGSLRVAATGTVVSETGFGIDAIAFAGTSLAVEAINVRGTAGGIAAESNGTGNLNVTTTGLVESTAGAGIRAITSSRAGELRVLANTVDAVDAGITVLSSGTGITSVTATGQVRASNGVGVSVRAEDNATDTVIRTAGVTASDAGIAVSHFGSGTLQIDATGDVVSELDSGIFARNSTGTGTTITATNVSGAENGINVIHSSEGNLDILASGLVQSAGDNGISASNNAISSDISIAVNAVDGGRDAINVNNRGLGATNVTATGAINARGGDGIFVRTAANTAGAVTINAAGITANEDGILATLFGTGDVSVTTTGAVLGQIDGVHVINNAGNGNVAVKVASTTGVRNGLEISNRSTGSVNVTATGALTGGAGFDGARIVNGTGAIGDVSGLDLIANLASASGGSSGAVLINNGTGRTAVTATGPLVGGTADGLFAGVFGDGGDLDVNVVDTTGGRYGVVTSYTGLADTRLVSTGTARGGESGVRLFSHTGTGSIVADIRNATGVEYGVETETQGNGGLTLLTRGIVEGGIAGIDVIATNGEDWSITNSGTIRNTSAVSSALAISSTGGMGTITNNGTLLGTVSLGAFVPDDDDDGGDGGQQALGRIRLAEVSDDDLGQTLINIGQWNSIGGTNEFLAAADTLINRAGARLIGGVSATLAEATIYSGLETLTNSGIVTMVDGGIGDVIRTSGNATFASGSVLAVDVGGAGSDRFVAGGTTTIATGAQLQVTNPQRPVLGTRYTVLESAGGVTGNFLFPTQQISAFLGYRAGYTPTSVFVELAKVRPFVAAGETSNQLSVSRILDVLPDNNPLVAAVLILPDDATARRAYDALSGEIHPGVRTALIEDSRLPRNAALARLDDREGGAIWGHALGSWGESDGSAGVADMRRDGYGAILGVDAALGDTATIGVAGAYLERDLDVDARASSGKLKSWHVVGYAGARFGDFGVKLGGGYASASVETLRGVVFPGISQALTADYDGSTLQGFAEAGYRVAVGGGYVEPFAQVTTIRAETDAFTETGGSAALTAGKERTNATLSTAGVRFETSRAGAFSVSGMGGWQHGFGSIDPTTSFRFASGGGAFTVIGAGRSRDAAVATVDAKFRLSERVTFAVSYDGALGSAGADHSVTGGLRIAF